MSTCATALFSTGSELSALERKLRQSTSDNGFNEPAIPILLPEGRPPGWYSDAAAPLSQQVYVLSAQRVCRKPPKSISYQILPRKHGRDTEVQEERAVLTGPLGPWLGIGGTKVSVPYAAPPSCAPRLAALTPFPPSRFSLLCSVCVWSAVKI